MSQALDDAQTKVLSPLKSIGTDVLVTRVVGATDSSGSTSSRPGGAGLQAGPGAGGPGGGGGFFGRGPASNLNSEDASALLAENKGLYDCSASDTALLPNSCTAVVENYF